MLLEPKSSPFLSPLSWTCKTRAPPEPRPSPEMRHPPLAQIRQPSMTNRHIHVSAGYRALLVSRLGNSSHIIKHAITTTSRGGVAATVASLNGTSHFYQTRALRELQLHDTLAHVPSCDTGYRLYPICNFTGRRHCPLDVDQAVGVSSHMLA